MPDGTPPRVQISDGTDTVLVDSNKALSVAAQATSAAPTSTRLSDGTSFYDGTKTGQLPTSLVGGRLDTQVGAALPAGTNAIGKMVGANTEGRSGVPWPRGLALQKNETADNSDKTLTVPAGKIWRVYWAFARIETSATGGSRQIVFSLRDDSSVDIYRVRTLTFTGTNSAVDWTFMNGVEGVAKLDGGDGSAPFPSEVWLPAGFDINFDNTPISGDTIKVYAMVDEMDNS